MHITYIRLKCQPPVGGWKLWYWTKYPDKHNADVKTGFHVLSDVQVQLTVTQAICIV